MDVRAHIEENPVRVSATTARSGIALVKQVLKRAPSHHGLRSTRTEVDRAQHRWRAVKAERRRTEGKP